ncbi:hypothetical protein LMG667_04705 [Xanthomonas euvesicatoria]|uniref:hypothetical protein n=1 Tax=Xanthomonas euvesicatoria TaxID=456327 RepID=UPI00080E28D0|nr:hypothetical protein [Xanthomonas euvesicatoria]OCG89385.1 hypothetical protein LMG667_04705 [Xanthomonas euvesicatoria]
MTGAPVKAEDLRNALRLRVPERSHALLFEVADRAGANTGQFADAVSVGFWPKHGLAIEGYEIQTSRSDWLQALREAVEPKPVYKFCDRWWLVADRGVAELKEIPELWGFLEFDGTVLRKRKDAPLLAPEVFTREFIVSMLRRHAGLDEAMSKAQVEAITSKTRAEIQAKSDAHLEAVIGSRVRNAEEGLRKLALIKEKTGIDLLSFAPAEDWINAIAFLTENEGWSRRLSARGLADIRDKASDLVLEIDAFTAKKPAGK